MSPRRMDKSSFRDGARVSVTIRGTEVPATQQLLEIESLRYYPENPRIYSIVRSHGKNPSQDDMQEALQGTEHVKELAQDIKRNGGLIDPLYVKDGSFEVIEGNSRLAALRSLYDQNPVTWGRAKCIVLPGDLDERSISTLLGQWHLKGKREWLPYEQAGFLYRRHKKQGIDLDRLAAEVGLARKRIALLVDAYAFMEDNDDGEREHWSYYEEYLKSNKVNRARVQYPRLDKVVVRGIKDGDFGRAQDFRDWLPVVCENNRVLKGFVHGDLDLEEAHERAVEVGGDNTPYKRLKKFRVWLADHEAQKELSSTDGRLRDNIRFEVGKIHTISGRLFSKLD